MRKLLLKNNNKGLTMIELIMTVALVSVFFGAVTIAVPRCMEEYIMMKKTSEAMELTSILENGIQTELGGAKEFSFSEEKGISYEKNSQVRVFPLSASIGYEAKEGECSYSVSKGSDGVSSITIKGRPRVYGAVYDSGLYGNMTVELVITYKGNGQNMSMKMTVYDEEHNSLCVSEKPIILYN